MFVQEKEQLEVVVVVLVVVVNSEVKAEVEASRRLASSEVSLSK